MLASQRVAGYDAVVLEANDASALAKWLDERGYARRPDLVDWLAPYVNARWKMTAFRDVASPRPGTDDLFFSPSTDRRPVRPPPVVLDEPYKIPILLDVLAILGGGAWITFVARRRLKQVSAR